MNDFPLPIQHLGRYDLVRVLGQGAMGVVYEGRDPNLDRRVAIKTVRVVGMGAEEIAEYEHRFKTEARSAGRLQHPNIVSVYDSDKHVDATGQTAYIVMEFVQGEDLKHFLDQGKRFSLEQTAYMMSDLLAALDYAHKNKIIHRDIKPANMLLTKEGRIKLTDFGVARITDSGEMTKTSGGTVGTLKYMSPEQVAGKGVDASSDLFSAGIVLYQLLTGVRPFDGEGYLDIVSKIVKEDPKPPSHIMGALPPSLDAVVAKALAKSKLDRFADAASFSAALKSAVNNADLTITPSAQARPEVLEGIGTFPGSLGGNTGSTVTQELELVYWKDIKESNEPEVLEGFLRRFPVGIYSDLAKRKLKAIADTDQATGASSRYEATQVRQLNPPIILQDSTQGVATKKQADALDETRLGKSPAATVSSAGNDSVYGPSTQFAATQFPPTEPGSLGSLPDSAASSLASELVTEPAQLPSLAAKKSSSSPKWALMGLGVLLAGAAAYWFTNSSSPEPIATDPSASVATVTATVSTPDPTSTIASGTTESITATASATNSAPTLTTASAPTSTIAAVSPTLSPASAAAARAALAKRRASAPGSASSASQPSVASPSGSAPVEPSASPTPSQAATTNPATPSATQPPANASASSPRDACTGRLLLGYLSCISEQCERPVFRNHPICVERREMEERRRNNS